MLKTINNDKILWIPLDLPPIEKEITLDNINNFYNFVPNVLDLLFWVGYLFPYPIRI